MGATAPPWAPEPPTPARYFGTGTDTWELPSCSAEVKTSESAVTAEVRGPKQVFNSPWCQTVRVMSEWKQRQFARRQVRRKHLWTSRRSFCIGKKKKKKRLKRPLFPPLLFKSLFYVWETFKPCLGHQSPNIKEFCIEDTASNMIDDNLDFSGFEEYAK